MREAVYMPHFIVYRPVSQSASPEVSLLKGFKTLWQPKVFLSSVTTLMLLVGIPTTRQNEILAFSIIASNFATGG